MLLHEPVNTDKGQSMANLINSESFQKQRFASISNKYCARCSNNPDRVLCDSFSSALTSHPASVGLTIKSFTETY